MNTLSLFGDEREAVLARIARDFGEPRLTVELVPHKAWYKNVWNVVRSRDWNRIRKATYASAGHRCEICGGVGARSAVACHERWEIEDWCCTSFLSGFIALCPACHDVKHIGRAMTQGRREEAERHLRTLNGWSADEVRDYLSAIGVLWQLRNAEESWYVDVWSWLKRAGIEPCRTFADIGSDGKVLRRRSAARVLSPRPARSRAPRTSRP